MNLGKERGQQGNLIDFGERYQRPGVGDDDRFHGEFTARSGRKLR